MVGGNVTTVATTLNSWAVLRELSAPQDQPSGPALWNKEGVEIHRRFFNEEELAPYHAEWLRENQERNQRPGGWTHCTPYMQHIELFKLLTNGRLADVLLGLVGEPMGVHLNLTGWVTTERDWHQDSYLNPPHVGDSYAAVWIALADIHLDSGPFQYVLGSHRWPTVRRERILDALGYTLATAPATWPKESERMLTSVFEGEIARRPGNVVTYLPNLGDVLIWHGRLVHRGSKANIPGMCRPALIAHYSGIHHRQDMPEAERAHGGGWYFPLTERVPV